MYRILQEEGIDLPRYAVLNRDPDHPEGGSDFLSAVYVSVWGCGGDGILSTVQKSGQTRKYRSLLTSSTTHTSWRLELLASPQTSVGPLEWL